MKKIFKNNRGRVIGWLNEETYYKKVKSTVHRMRNYGGAYGIDKNVIEEIRDKCQLIRIMEVDTKNIYQSTLANFLEHSIGINFDGPQLILPLKFWEKEDNANLKLL